MKEKIKARLKVKYPGVNLSNKRLDAIADKIEKKVATDADDAAIDTALDTMNDYHSFADIAKDDDRMRTLEAAKPKDEPKPDPAKPDQAKPADDMPEWAKALVEQNKQMAATLQGFQTEKQQKSIAEKVKGHEKLKDIKPSFYQNWTLPAKDEEVDAFVDKVVADHTAFVQENNFTQAQGFPIPPKSSGGAGAKVDPAVVAFAKQQNDAVKKTT